MWEHEEATSIVGMLFVMDSIAKISWHIFRFFSFFQRRHFVNKFSLSIICERKENCCCLVIKHVFQHVTYISSLSTLWKRRRRLRTFTLYTHWRKGKKQQFSSGCGVGEKFLLDKNFRFLNFPFLLSEKLKRRNKNKNDFIVYEKFTLRNDS